MEVVNQLLQGCRSDWRGLSSRIRAQLDDVPGLVWAVVLAVGLTGMALTVAAVRESPATLPRTLPWPLLTVAAIAIQRLPVTCHIRSQTLGLDFFAVPVVVGAATVPARTLIGALVLATLVVQVLRRSNGARFAFNLVNQLNGMVLSLLVLRAVTHGHYPVSPVDWLGVAAAILTYELVTDIAVIAVMAAAGAVPHGDYFRGLALQLTILIPLSCTLAITAIEAYWAQPWALAILSGPCMVAAAMYRSSNRLRGRLADVQSLYDFTVHLGGIAEMPEMLEAALRETRDTLRCRRVELGVRQAGRILSYQLDGAGSLVREALPAGDLERQLLRDGRPRLFQVGHGDPVLTRRGYSDLIAVPLSVGESNSAVLMAGNRQGEGSGPFQPEDLNLLQALAAHLSTALTSCSRLDRLRLEVAAREHQANHDGLTGLANRTLFSQMVTEALKERSPSRLLAVMLMDLDGFKEINDTLGHHTGDAVLKEVAWRVKAAVGGKQFASRLGGDEFAFLLPAATSMKDVTETAARLLRAVAAPVAVEGMVLSVHASIGVATAPVEGADASSLLRRADVAMYAAKNSSRGLAVYDPRIDHHSPRRLLLASELRRAVETYEGLDLWYQPVAELPSDRIAGFEALLRWNHPELGFVSPDEFIPVAEQSGLIEPLTWWVMRTALHELRQWLASGHPVTMAVNISVRSLFDAAIVDRLRHLLKETGVPPANVVLEITESSMMLDQSRSEGVLRQLARLGVRLAIDDFGTGYSSLSRLKDLPVDMVKIDRSFVKNMCSDKGDQAIVRSTIELATVMGYGVVAEGVEDQQTWDELSRLGCTHAQGYFLARPMPAGACRAWVRAGRPGDSPVAPTAALPAL